MKKLFKPTSLLLAATIAVSVALSGCSGNKKAAVKPTALNVGLTGDIVSLDPAFAYDSNTVQVVDQVTEGLLGFDNSNKLVCRLAKSWKAVNNKTYVYEIRNNVKFSDGSPMTMQDVLFSLNRTKDPKTASNEGWMFSDVKSITQTGPWGVTVKLSKPEATWQYILATTAGHIISKKYYEAHKNNFGKPQGGVLGTGAYKFKKWVTGNEIDLVKNNNYWDKTSKPQIKSIAYKVIPETSTLLTAVKTGQIDMTVLPPSDTLSQFKSYKNVNTILNDGYQALDICFNCQRAPFNDVNVRRAVSSAVDTVSINKNITTFQIQSNALPFGKPVAAFDTKSWMNFGKTDKYCTYNMTKAKEYLAKSKYPKGFSCNIIVNSSDTCNNSICLALQQSLKQLNINLNIKKVTYNDFISYAYGNKMDKNGKRDYDMFIWSWLSDYPDPAGYMVPMYSSANIGQGGSNWSAYTNSQVDSLLNKQDQTLDNSKRTQYLQQAVHIANNEAAYCVVGYPKDVFVLNKKFNFKPSSSWFYNMYFKNITAN